jgi:acetyl esterase
VILSKPLVADIMARVLSAVINAKPKPGVTFPEIRGHTTEITIPTRRGEVAATLYQPETTVPTPGVYVNIHGGGFVIGHREQDDPWCRYLATHANVVVINTDYVLAPRYRFPAPIEQIYDELVWASAPQRNWDGSRLCVGGQSAGGNLSAAVSRMALENGGPAISLQMLHYPPLDLVTPTAEKYSPIGSAAVLKPWLGEVFDTAYIPDRAQRRHRWASPAWGTNADNISGIAPALVITAEYDRLRDEAKHYADKLAEVGSLADYHEIRGVDHGYNIMSDATAVTRQMYDLIVDHVRRAIS